MNRNYNLKLDLQFRCNNQTMKFNQFDNNTSDFFIKISSGGKSFDVEKAIVVLAIIKPSGKVASQFVEVENGLIYSDLKASMKDEIGTYTAQAMLILEDERVVTDTINYEVNESKILSAFIEDTENQEDYTLLTDMLNRLSTIEISEEQRMINEAERILSEENRKIEEAKRVEAELIRQHEEADRAKYDATRESNENIRKRNESIRLANETNRIDEEAKRVEEEAKRKLAEEERKANYDFMTEDEERRRSEANAHKEAEILRVQAETNRVNEEAKRRTTEQARVSAENTRVSNENTREANETKRVEAETQRQSRYNSFITDAEANANNFENYTNNAKVKEEERKANELTRKNQETQRVSNENERLANEETRKANEVVREENEISRQDIFEDKVDEVDKKIVELNTTKENFVSSINTKVDTKISEIEVAKSDMTNTVSNKVNEVETRFNALTSKQQQDAEVIDARDGETSLKARLDRDIEKAKQVYVNVEGSHISTDSSSGYAKDVEIKGNTIQDASNLADIRSVGDKVEGQELYEIPVLSVGKNLFDGKLELGYYSNGNPANGNNIRSVNFIKVKPNTNYIYVIKNANTNIWSVQYDKDLNFIKNSYNSFITDANCSYIKFYTENSGISSSINTIQIQLEEGTVATPYEPYQEDKLTILSPVQLEKVGDVRDRIIEKDGVWGVEKNVGAYIFDTSLLNLTFEPSNTNIQYYTENILPNALKDVHSINNINSFCPSIERDYRVDCKVISCWNTTSIAFAMPKELYPTITDFKNSIPKEIELKYKLAEPQFIPLPHSQQIKLRTFANKTNISFGCEIEGTIKAQVPKSLGSTVNTHTEQISNLNKELDRVKKLEESTVSTVETESDFTTVEATSNGYFEDVKLEGKTLVNLSTIKQATFESRFIRIPLLKNISPVKKFTLSLQVSSNTLPNGFRVRFRDMNKGVTSSAVSIYGSVMINVVCDIDDATHIEFYTFNENDYNNGYNALLDNIVLLEGDHTQNPPSYFEGLKSVCQSASEDGVDEIVVSSVKGDGNLFDGELEIGTVNSNNGTDQAYLPRCRNKGFITIKENSNYSIKVPSNYFINRVFYYGSSYNYISNLPIDNNQRTFTTPSGARYLRFAIGVQGDSNISQTNLVELRNTLELKCGELTTEYTPHQSDKKRLLYYNEETQTWEKPILRQWDSIEKHADGKYYYHQRSGEVVLNGSENFERISSGDGLDTLYFAIQINAKSSSICVSDKFIYNKTIWNSNNESCKIGGEGKFELVISKSKLSTQDVEGFKKWLQANNVTVVYQLAQEKVYECTNIDLITYTNETNYIVECGAIAPKTTLKVHNNISNVVSLLQKKVSLLESNITSYMITQNRLMLASRYNADTVSFKVDVATLRNSFEYDNDLYELILNNILVGKDNYDREYIENLIIFYWMDFVISDEMYLTLFEIIEEQHNPKIEEETPLI